MRLFTAVLLTDEMKDALCGAARRLREHAASGSFTRRENLHLTLCFLGETDRVDAARQAMDRVDAEPFSIRLGGLGRFCRDGGDLYWMGLEQSRALPEVQGALARELRAAGFRLEDRAYRPHLTLGREVRLEPGFDFRALEQGMHRPRMRVERLSLMCSQRIQGRLTYTEISARELRGKETAR